MKIKNFPVFYYRFIFPLEQIKNFVAQKIKNQQTDVELVSIKERVCSMSNLLLHTDWSPFSDYQRVIAKLGFAKKIQNLSMVFDVLDKPSEDLTKESLLNFMQNIVDELIACAHLLNFLETAENTLQDKITENASLLAKSLPAFLASMREKGKSEENIMGIQKLSDMVSNLNISNSIGVVENCNDSYSYAKKANSAPVGEQVYAMLMQFFNLCSNEGLQNFVEDMFFNSDQINPNSGYQGLDMSKVNVFDNKLALQRFAIEQINLYKTAYANFMADLQQQSVEQEIELDSDSTSSPSAQ